MSHIKDSRQTYMKQKYVGDTIFSIRYKIFPDLELDEDESSDLSIYYFKSQDIAQTSFPILMELFNDLRI